MAFKPNDVALGGVPLPYSSARRCLHPGGVVFFRDYGVYDLPMLRFPPEQRLEDRLYARGDGTLAHFFTLETIRRCFRDAGFVEGGELGALRVSGHGDAGGVRSDKSETEGDTGPGGDTPGDGGDGIGGESYGQTGGGGGAGEGGASSSEAVRYCCVHNENKKKGLLMRRVFVHGTWSNPSTGCAVE